jgi:hypothetical protein
LQSKKELLPPPKNSAAAAFIISIHFMNGEPPCGLSPLAGYSILYIPNFFKLRKDLETITIKKKIYMSLLSTFLQPIYNDAPEPWQIGFQDGASPGFEGITELHDSILFFLVVISVGVFWALGSVMINFNSTSSPIVYKYANHGTKCAFMLNQII